MPNRVYLGNDGGMYRSEANGDSGWIHGTNMPWLQEYHVAVSQQRPNRIAIGLQDNGSNRSWTNVNEPVADPVAANWTSYGGGDGHYVVIDSSDDTYYYSCSQNAGCSGVHDLSSTTTTLSAAAAVGATNVKLASVTGLVVGNTITIDSTGANPETVTMTTVGTAGAAGTGVTFAPALAFAHASGATVVKNGVTGTQSLGFGSRGSGLRCTTDAPLVQDPSSSTTLYLGCNKLSRSTNRGANWTTIAAPDALTGPAPADDGPNNNPLYAGQFPTISTIAPSKSDPNTIYVGTDNGRLWKTTDLGGTWQEFPNPFAPDPARWVTSVIVDPLDSNHAYASYGGFREGYTSANVYETTDGATWTNVSGNLPNAPVNFLAYDRYERHRVRGDRLRCLLRAEGQALEEARRQPAEHGHRGSEDPGRERQALRRDLRPRHVADPARGGQALSTYRARSRAMARDLVPTKAPAQSYNRRGRWPSSRAGPSPSSSRTCEGSTRLLKQLRERYGEVLAEHRRILRAAFDEHGGQEIDTQGDAFFVAFRKATDAALAAVDAQRGLAEHAWPDGRGASRANGDAHRRAERRRRGVPRARRSSRGADHGGGARRSSAPVAGDRARSSRTTSCRGSACATSASIRSRTSIDPSTSISSTSTAFRVEFPPLRTAEAPTAYTGRVDELEGAARAAFWRGRLRTRRRVVAAIVAVLLAVGLIGSLIVVLGGSRLRTRCHRSMPTPSGWSIPRPARSRTK